MLASALILGALGLWESPDYGDAPPGTLDPVAAVSSVTNLLKEGKCQVISTFEIDASDRLHVKRVTKATFATCGTASLLRTRTAVKDRTEAGKTTLVPDDRCVEKRWEKNGSLVNIVLKPGQVPDWPLTSRAPSREDIEAVFLRSDPIDGGNAIYSEVDLLPRFAGTPAGTGLTFAQMVKDHGPEGFALKRVKWASEDRATRVRYDFDSPDYGMISVTFLKIADGWYPVTIERIHLTEHKVLPDSFLTPEELSAGLGKLKNFSRFKGEFPEPYNGLDRLDATYEMTYRPPQTSGRVLPHSVKLREVAFLRDQQSVMTTLLDFTEIHPEAVPCNEVRDAMMRIPDSCLAFRQGEKTAWTTKGGEVVPDVDGVALSLAGQEKFSPRSRISGLVWLNVVGLLAVLFWLYLRSRRGESVEKGGDA